jgi:predicted dehydrogenase
LLEADLKPDVINIATPNGLHASQAIQCLDAGTHVVIEKPFALSTTAAELSFEIATGKEECFCGDAKQVQPSRHLVKRNIGK